MTGAGSPIAIIGVGLRLPGADSLDGFWTHLAAARSLITEVPRRRWDAAQWQGNPAQGNKTNSIWGGFVADADCFDAAFFGISPREAAWMDPQQRFALEMAWHAVEDAGYRPAALAGSRTGVFMGVCHWDYAELLEKHLTQLDAYTPTGIAFSIIANRVSHFFDLRGPSVTNDTACAASLTSVNDAVRALQSGQCDLALAGGVNLIWSPNHFVAFAKAGMLSKDGKAKAFDQAADGYVRGEGGAMLLLKPLDRALADGDPIHGVIRGVGVNHGGRTNSLTVTNPQAQAALIAEVHQAADIAPDSVGYIEAHGPGTPLGDPIEISGLKQAFARLHAQSGTSPRPGSCGIGSVKTNIGHLEGAAGVAGMVKVLAALRHGVLPANVGFERLNSLIDLAGTPFRIQAEATPWPATPGQPRRAGISSFGFGGSNAHVVVEEPPALETPPAGSGPWVVPLSAPDPARLAALAAALLEIQAPLDALAHTLQSGRQSFEARLAVRAAHWDELATALRAFLDGGGHPALIHDGPVGRWLEGGEIDWAALWSGPPPRRIHAPLTPFARQRHWFDLSLGAKDDAPRLHPLLHRNRSDFAGLRFETRLDLPDFVWADHHVGGAQVLPGVAALEMARAAATLAGESAPSAWAFENVVWTRPILAGDGPATLDLRLTRQGDGAIAFVLREAANTGPVANCQGLLRPQPAGTPPVADLAALRAAAPTPLAVEECYARLRASGVVHGPAFQALAKVQRGPGQVLAQLKLGRRLLPTLAAMPLHPVLLDAAIQAWVGLEDGQGGGAAVPFACRRMEILGPCEASMWAHVRPASTADGGGLRRLDIDLYGKDGGLRVSLRDLALRVMTAEAAPAPISTPEAEPAPVILAQGGWQPMPRSASRATPMETTVILAGLAPELVPGAMALEPAGEEAATVQSWYAALHGRIKALLQARPRGRQLILVLAPAALPEVLTAPLAALLRTAALEQPKLEGSLIRLDGAWDAGGLAALIAGESRRDDAWSELRVGVEGNRQAWVPAEITLPAARPALDPEGVYWITGGLGGLGRIFVRWLMARGARRLLLSGRRAEADLSGLEADGVELRYLPCDMADGAAVRRVAAAMGPLKGVIHAAGVLDDGFILTRDAAAEAGVFAPKLAGTLHLDAATAHAPLDFMVLCSSVAATFGNAGQAAYGAANAFLDAFAGQRQGATLSIAWPLWAEGGMGVDAATLAALHRRFGTVPMPTAAGLDALDRIIAAGSGRVTVLHGETARLRQSLAEMGRPTDGGQESAAAAPSDLAGRTLDFVRSLLAEVLQLEPGQIRANRKLDEYGLDSIAIVDATNRLEEALGPLSKTMFFEYVDLNGIAGHLVEEHGEALAALLADATPAAPAQPARQAAEPRRHEPPPADGRDTHDIAIVGLSLRVAKAAGQREFWDMLSQGLHGFEPYPASRWDHAALLHPERDVLGKTVVRTGAFLDDIAAFDPRYFRISQYEAELMSPEVRLFLEASVEAFEDAGYSRETLRSRLGGDVAVIMGSMTNEYDLYGFQNMLMRGALASGSYTGTIPNMVSYFYGFTGPSYFLDTMCSASSTCVHEAVHMLRAGRCKMALAGGVSLLLHPQKLIATSQEHFTSKTAEVIRGYGLGADGTILGEGVGALVLKTLADARRDGDHIYGVIRGTAISNAGLRNGFTVPNPHQQAQAIQGALEDAGIGADTIGYVEGHGSGTSLGDPIEIRALSQVFAKSGAGLQSCPIGTVKGNVAHLLAASGLAGIAKVLMQLGHGQLAPSLHAETLNPNIAFEKTPFRVQRQLAPWPRRLDLAGAELPRRAGVTSIGAGGMNSHIIIEEFIPPPEAPEAPEPQLLVFSAMTEATLAKVLHRFYDHLGSHPEHSLADLAHTLQVGRNELPCRLALVATDRATLVQAVAALRDRPGDAPFFTRSILDKDPETAGLAEAMECRDLARVAAAWVSGAAVDWERLQAGRRPRRLSLPAYPFEKVRCWYPEFADAPSVVRPLGARLKLHPLVGTNLSDLSGLRYRTALHPGELLDYAHKRDGGYALSPLAAAEAMAALARIAGLDGPLTLSGLTIHREVDWTTARELAASLEPGTDGLLIRLETDAAPWAEGRVGTGAATELPPGPDLVGAQDCDLYAALRSRGFDFRPYLETVAGTRILADGSVLCTLRPDPPQQDRFKRLEQIPAAALGAGFQALLLAAPPGAVLSGIDGISLRPEGESITQVLARPEGEGRFGLWFLGQGGAVVARMAGLRLAAAGVTPEAARPPAAEDDAAARLGLELRAIAAGLLKFAPEQVNPRDAFQDLGFDSISLTRLAEAISTAYGITLSPAVFFECDHLDALGAHLMARHGITPQAPRPTQPALAAQSRVTAPPKPRRDAVAVIGMAARLPGSPDAEAFFAHLLAGRDLTSDLPLNRYGAAYAERLAQAGFARRGGFLDDIDRFDAAFFRVSPVEAERMDPQQRLMLETVWRTLEDAGYAPDRLPADTGVFMGASALDYALLLRDHGVAGDGYVATGNSLAMIANRVSHVLNLHGPSETLDTACSSSLVALLRAVESLRHHGCAAALAGGVNLTLAAEGFEGPHQAGMLSPEGRCKAFGAGADGYGRGEGVVAVLLKRLEDAERDGDRILGLIIGGAENHGGRAGSLTAPSVTAQAGLIQAAMAGIDPRGISYMEAHGTGTALGDPVEVNGLRRAYGALLGSENVAEPFIALGTVKSNMGHLEAAAGLAGLVKVLLAMRHGTLPATLHCDPPNPHLELAGGPFHLLRQAQPWPATPGKPRRAGISSFGFGGTNAHVVVEDYPAASPARAPLPPRAFADTRFWLPGAGTASLVLVPGWDEAPLNAGAPPPMRRVVIACEIAVAPGHGAELRPVTLPEGDMGKRYGAMAQAVLGMVQELARHDGPVLVQLAVPRGDERQLYAGLGAMLATAALESAGLRAQVVEVEAGMGPEPLARLLADEAAGPGESRIRHQGGRRLARRWRELPAGPSPAPIWRPRGIFLITGGMGALGRIIARHIATTTPGAVLVLAGSAAEDGERSAFLAQLRGLGAVAAYRRVHMADGEAVAALVRNIVEIHGRLDTVIHCAGVLRDGFIARKSAADLDAVLGPKAGGAMALAQACAGLDLDRLVLFASLSGVAGNAGQADYAAANGFLDALAEFRGLPVVAIDWPLWRDGGMGIDDATAEALFNRMGQRPLSTEAGLAALHRIAAAGVTQAAVMAGDGPRIRAFFAGLDAPPAEAPAMAPDGDLGARVAAELGRLFARVGGFAPEAIKPATPLEEYGIDSLMITRLNAALGDVFGALPKTLFFQYRTLAGVAGHLAARQTEACRRWTGAARAEAPAPVLAAQPRQAPPPAAEPIAIIGLSGRYPGAGDLAAFWDNLAAGRDAVSEIPPERWSLDGFFLPDRDEAVAQGRSYAKWGAFLDGFADFDPLFFKISPRDAAAMDPQERLVLMAAWEACEDAGYDRARLARACPGPNGARVGVYVGVTKTGFALHPPFASEGGAVVRPMTSFAGMANRVSHVLNLGGPSLPVDTMCSSSLTAIHLACEELRRGGIGMALVAGVNLYLHPSTYVDLCAARMLSPDGRCRSFGKGANGFVPGEGVGCLMLKPLSAAQADGDRIHAVIRASAINHGGHTNGYTVPNPAAQAELIRDALAQAGLNARAVTCIEAHGTGTELGDPIELAGLTQAFAPDTQDRAFCALGSVKSNIGHLEAAAGMASVTKVVLQMKHGLLAPSLHAAEANPNLDLEDSPFTLQRGLTPWPAGRRIAGVSSFGAGGANAHVIIEDWPAPAATPTDGPQAVVLSARTPEALRRQAERLLAVLGSGTAAAPADLAADIRRELAALLAVAPQDLDGAEPFDCLGLDPSQRLALRRRIEERFGLALDAAAFAGLETPDQLAAHVAGRLGPVAPAPSLADLAHTLQVGREAMEHRLALVVESVPALAAALGGWLAGRGIPTGHTPLDALAARWMAGDAVDWAALPRSARPSMVSLPPYPFERRRFWLPVASGLAEMVTAPRGDEALRAQAERLDRHIAAILAATLRPIPAAAIIPALARWHGAAQAFLTGQEAMEPPQAWAQWEALRRAGGPAAQMALAETTLRALPDILSGLRAATAVMFPDGAIGLVEAVYKDNPVAARFSRALAAAAEAFVRGSARPSLRILEIGAGTGGTSEKVFEALEPHRGRLAEYRYTDLSRAFLIHAERSYGPRLPMLKTALFDVEKPLAGQEVEPGAYDLVIAANVLHATADMARTLDHVRQLLAPGGMLLINETSMATAFTHVTFGLLEGWWRFTDPERRIPGTPSLSPESWRSLLAGAGLEWVCGSAPAECALGQQIIAARAPLAVQRVPVVTDGLGDRLRILLGETLNVAPAGIVADRPFADYGLDSILGAELVHKIRQGLGVRLDHTQLFDFTTLAQLEAFLAEQSPAPAPSAPAPAAAPAPAGRQPIAPAAAGRQPIAIIGMSGRFAGSPDPEALWRHLMAGDDLVGPVTRFDLEPYYRDAPPGSYGKHGSFIDGVENFDPVFFGISGLEATYMDPQQRLFLEEAWKTLENAGHAGDDMVGRRCGVFVGCSAGDYQELFRTQPPGQAFWGNTSSLIPARIAYFLDLKGPAIAVDTACSSSLVALHMACQSLWSGESEMALAGGVFVQCSPRFYRSANQAAMLSPSGRCAAFGAGADGIVPGEAVGAVLLRPLAEAQADGDTILGVIVASGINQDGTTNGITAPSAASQERLIRGVYGDFAIDPASIGLVEAHGTGTRLGDPIEHAALARAFGGTGVKSCALGSVKSNIGHATTAAGMAGLIKVLLGLRHATIPPSLHFNGGNPAIRFEDGPFFVNSQPMAWTPAPGGRRRGAISSFGFSGTNAHVVVEEAPPQAPAADDGTARLFVLSARTAEHLRQLAEAMALHVETHPGLGGADLAFTLLAGRRGLRHRLAVVALGPADLAARLRRWLAGAESGVLSAELDDKAPPPRPDEAGPDQLAAFWLRGGKLDPSALFPGPRRRLPLPNTPLAAMRCWVEAAPAAPAERPKALPLRLADPAALAGPFTPRSPGRVVLAPLAPLGGGAVTRRPDGDGVRVVVVSGDGGGALGAELAAIAADESLRAVVVVADTAPAALDCTLPVVMAGARAAAADFHAATEAEATALARQIAQAPRLALVELKRAMRSAPIPEDAANWPLAEAGTPGPARPLPLSTPHMSLEAFDDGVVLLRMSERQHKNSFTGPFMDGLAEAFAAIARLDGAKAVVMTGFDGYFACGGTRDGLEALQQGATRFTDRKIYSLPLDCPLPVIAAMQGHAIGAGWSLGMFCDLALFAADSVYHSNYLWYGFTPGAGATLVFPHRLGDCLGREVLFTAREYKGRELAALRPGLRVLPAAQVLPQALALAHGLARQPREILLALKAEAAQPLRERLDATFARELAMHERTFIGNPRVKERIEQMFPAAPPLAQAAPAAGCDHVRQTVIASLAEDLMIPAADIRDGAGFLELGLDSILAVTWVRRLNGLLGSQLPATIIYAHPTVGALVEHLAGRPAAPAPAPVPPAGQDHIRQTVIASLAEDLMIPAADIRDGAGFLELGLDSILAVTWVRRLNGLLGLDLPATVIYAHPTIGALIGHVSKRAPAPAAAPPIQPAPPPPAPVSAAATRSRKARSESDAVAIIGASGRFPKAMDLDAFWDNIAQGRDCIGEVPPDRWDVERFYHPDPLHPGTSSCRQMGALDDIDRFDAAFFNITPLEAELMDPQQRLFLQHAWQAIEDAGLSPAAISGQGCGIFVGAGPSGYGDLIDEHNTYSLLGCSGSILAARIAHLLDLRGPCISLDTACSSSLVALAEACNSLLVGDSDLALAGGVCVLIGPDMFIDTSKVNMLSAEGRCFTFDSRANGFVPGEGAGVMLLKRLEDAQRDGDPIHAVIRGWGINQDGRTNGITAPNPQAQTRLLRGVYDRFGIDPAGIGLVECHGTGTPLGDPIEVEGLTDAFAGAGAAPGGCALGSVKSNVGHLLAAAGIAGALKAMLAVERGQIPPTINFQTQNPHIDLTGTPFAVSTALRPWPRGHRRAAISAFGFSGTNAHVVIGEPPPPAAAAPSPGPWVFALSARTPERLAAYAGVMERFVAARPDLPLGDLAHTLQVGRKPLGCRLAFVFHHRDGLLQALASVVAGRPAAGVILSQGEADAVALFQRDDAARALIAGWLASGEADRLAKVAELWAKGLEVDWRAGPPGRRLHLPAYPFARDRHWVAARPEAAPPSSAPAPLLDGPARFSLRLQGDEPYLTSHTSGTDRLLLGLFLPELAREAAERAGGQPIRGLKQLIWGQPLRINGKARSLGVTLARDGEGLLYHVTADGDDGAPCHLGAVADAQDSLFQPAPFRPGGSDVGEDFRRFAAGCAAHSGPPAPEAAQIRAVWRQGEELLARLAPSGRDRAMVFDPLILDAVWRLVAFRAAGWRAEGGALPFPLAMDAIWAEGGLPEELFVRVWNRPALTIALSDGQGRTRLCLDGVQLAPVGDLVEILIGGNATS